MKPLIVPRDDEAILDLCAPLLSRDYSVPPRHGAGRPLDGFSAHVADAWRFPFVGPHRDLESASPHADTTFDDVTFVYFEPNAPAPAAVQVFGSFAPLYEALPLRRLGSSRIFAVTLAIPKAEIHTYRFRVDGASRLDPVNPQRAFADNGVESSRFFTSECTSFVELNPQEVLVLDRLTAHILPMNTRAASRFLQGYVDHLDQEVRRKQLARAGRLDATLGAVSYIDKALARSERQHRVDYAICLAEIRRLMELRHPGLDLRVVAKDSWVELYEELGRGLHGEVPGWRYERYGRPKHFLELLRRHTFTGAFSHPSHGGNAGASGWAWLADRFEDAAGNTLFDWRRHQPPPWGDSLAYHG